MDPKFYWVRLRVNSSLSKKDLEAAIEAALEVPQIATVGQVHIIQDGEIIGLPPKDSSGKPATYLAEGQASPL